MLYLMMSSCVFVLSVLVFVKIRIAETSNIHSTRSIGLVYLRTAILLMNFLVMKKFMHINTIRQIVP